ncbi:hypothetical protein AB0H42_04070 [Nocardia sp. NPDC050799]|uniref:hypothetical protein n=1 Tax=Nocardia sp. NPDC050799 TaxID=3154842 RepID=UPI0033EB2C96
MIDTPEQWQEAKEAGHVTAEHILHRLHAIAIREFGIQGAAGYDEEGFICALVADGLRCERGVVLRVCTRDHPPPHVHIEISAEPSIKLKMNLVTGEFMGPTPEGWGKKVKYMRQLVKDNHSILVAWWEKSHGPIDIGVA